MISIFTFIVSTWMEEAWVPTIINSSPIDLALTFSEADGIDCSTTNCFAGGNITVGGDSRECVGTGSRSAISPPRALSVSGAH